MCPQSEQQHDQEHTIPSPMYVSVCFMSLDYNQGAACESLYCVPREMTTNKVVIYKKYLALAGKAQWVERGPVD